jgi:hypothetical protein
MLKKLILSYLAKTIIGSLKGGTKWLAITVLVAALVVQALGLDFEQLVDIVDAANQVLNEG